MDKEQAVPVILVLIPLLSPDGVFLLPDDSLHAGADTDPHAAAKFPEAFYELSQYQIREAFRN